MLRIGFRSLRPQHPYGKWTLLFERQEQQRQKAWGKMKRQLLEEGFDSGIRFDRIRISVHFPLLGLGCLLHRGKRLGTGREGAQRGILAEYIANQDTPCIEFRKFSLPEPREEYQTEAEVKAHLLIGKEMKPKELRLPPQQYFEMESTPVALEWSLYHRWMKQWLRYLQWYCQVAMRPDVTIGAVERIPLMMGHSYLVEPMANGQAESSNKVLKPIIEKMITDNPRVWHEVLSEALWAYRTSQRSSTGVTPFALTYGHDAKD
ncbi:hypothetical protein ZIOFF_076059 [Zingiber officinale]|uniref:Uncharacterized protein n=1 Tax=Zingiber officinale TaxID=94328 RepID=A0A8J5B897_ZINOF|nr:hypothetical protein ZIOFF_076059 [Zingiber officinale]